MNAESKKRILREARQFAEETYRKNQAMEHGVSPAEVDVSLASEAELWQLTLLGVYAACRTRKISEPEMREVLAVVIDPPKIDITIHSLEDLWEMIFPGKDNTQSGNYKDDGAMN